MGNYPDSPADSPPAFSFRRTVPRYTFAAITELTDSTTFRKISGRVEEISRNGCYVDTMQVLPVGTPLDVRISRDGETFVTKGEVIYITEWIGLGIAFIDAPKEQLAVLDSWLAERASTVALI